MEIKELQQIIDNSYRLYILRTSENHTIKEIVLGYSKMFIYNLAMASSLYEFFKDSIGENNSIYEGLNKKLEELLKNCKHDRLFEFLIDEIWCEDESFDFMSYKECDNFIGRVFDKYTKSGDDNTNEKD